MNEPLDEAEARMAGAVAHTREEFGKIRTGRANPALVADLPVAYYGTQTPLQQIAGVTVPEPRMLLISPYDQTALRDIERSIQQSDLGVNPSSDGSVVRVVFPELTEERRRDYVRLARDRAEEGRVAVRNVRRHAKSEIARLTEAGELSRDEGHRDSDALQALTDRYVSEIDKLLANKERELLEV